MDVVDDELQENKEGLRVIASPIGSQVVISSPSVNVLICDEDRKRLSYSYGIMKPCGGGRLHLQLPFFEVLSTQTLMHELSTNLQPPFIIIYKH